VEGDGGASYRKVATLTISPQISTSAALTECEHLAFTPWHGLTRASAVGASTGCPRPSNSASRKFAPSARPSKSRSIIRSEEAAMRRAAFLALC